MALAGRGRSPGTHPCLTYSACKGRGRKGALGAQGGQGGQEAPDAPHGRCQGAPEVQVGLAGPECSLPWDPRGDNRTCGRGPAGSPLPAPMMAGETWPPTRCALCWEGIPEHGPEHTLDRGSVPRRPSFPLHRSGRSWGLCPLESFRADGLPEGGTSRRTGVKGWVRAPMPPILLAGWGGPQAVTHQACPVPPLPGVGATFWALQASTAGLDLAQDVGDTGSGSGLQAARSPDLPESQGSLVGRGGRAHWSRRIRHPRAHPVRPSAPGLLYHPSPPVDGNAGLRQPGSRC